MAQSLCHARIEKRVRVILRKSNTIGRHQEIIKDVSLKLGYSNRYQRVQKETHLSRASSREHLPSASISASAGRPPVDLCCCWSSAIRCARTPTANQRSRSEHRRANAKPFLPSPSSQARGPIF